MEALPSRHSLPPFPRALRPLMHPMRSDICIHISRPLVQDVVASLRSLASELSLFPIALTHNKLTFLLALAIQYRRLLVQSGIQRSGSHQGFAHSDGSGARKHVVLQLVKRDVQLCNSTNPYKTEPRRHKTFQAPRSGARLPYHQRYDQGCYLRAYQNARDCGASSAKSWNCNRGTGQSSRTFQTRDL